MIEARLNRVEGQVRGIKRMYSQDKCDCVEIATQIQAVRGALAKVAMLILIDEARRCADKGDIKELEKIVETTFKSL